MDVDGHSSDHGNPNIMGESESPSGLLETRNHSVMRRWFPRPMGFPQWFQGLDLKKSKHVRKDDILSFIRRYQVQYPLRCHLVAQNWEPNTKQTETDHVHDRIQLYIHRPSIQESSNNIIHSGKTRELRNITMFNGKAHYKWQSSTAMLVITRG